MAVAGTMLAHQIAAKAAGMTVWIVPNRVTAGLDFSEADRIFPSLVELAGALKK